MLLKWLQQNLPASRLILALRAALFELYFTVVKVKGKGSYSC